MSGPSQTALDAARGPFPGFDGDIVKRSLEAAHDCTLGLDASVRLGDVTGALDAYAAEHVNAQAFWFSAYLRNLHAEGSL